MLRRVFPVENDFQFARRIYEREFGLRELAEEQRVCDVLRHAEFGRGLRRGGEVLVPRVRREAVARGDLHEAPVPLAARRERHLEVGVNPGAEGHRLRAAVLHRLLEVQPPGVQPVGHAMHERERIHRTRRVAVRQFHRQRRLGARDHAPRRPAREAVLPQRELAPAPRVVMLAARQVVEADHREQQRIPRPHLLRISVHNRLAEMQRVHEAVLGRGPRVTQ